MDLIVLNVRGTICIVPLANLEKAPKYSPLASLDETSIYYNAKRNEYYFDRNPVVFQHILDFLSTGTLHLPTDICSRRLRDEIEFWGLSPTDVQQCCWKTFYQTDEDMDVLKKLISSINKTNTHAIDNKFDKLPQQPGLKSRLFHFLNDYPTTAASKVWLLLMFSVIVLSIVIFVLSTIPEYREDITTDNNLIDIVNIDGFNKSLYRKPHVNNSFFYSTQPTSPIIVVDLITNTFLMSEWILQFFVCPDKKLFLISLLNVCDLFSWVHIYIRYAFLLSKPLHVLFQNLSTVTFVLYATRVFRIFRLGRYNTGMRILDLSLKSSAKELCVLVLSFGSVAIVFASSVYLCEIHTAKPIPDFLTALWWAIITMTTVGYGDIYPTSPIGYVIGTLCSFSGVLLIALPIGVTSSNFYDFYSFNKYRKRYIEEKEALISQMHVDSHSSIVQPSRKTCGLLIRSNTEETEHTQVL